MRKHGVPESPIFTKTFQVGDAGFYHIRADVPDMPIPPLPVRHKSGCGISFPVGRFETYASHFEIELALESGCKIDVIDGVRFEHINLDIFRDFVDRCERLRQVDYGGGIGLTAKFLQNALYGFFGMTPDKDDVIISVNQPDETYDPVIGDNGETNWTVWSRKTVADSINIQPAIAAWITAAARAYLLKQMWAEIDAGNMVVYCDTDSIFLKGNPVAILDSAYGDWKIENTFDSYELVASKCYHGETTGRHVYKCKGIPTRLLNPDDFDGRTSNKKQFVSLKNLIAVATGSVRGSIVTRSTPTWRSASNVVPREDDEKIFSKTFPKRLDTF
jgi:hypothetical protein